MADLVPPPRKHRHRYHGVFAPNRSGAERRCRRVAGGRMRGRHS
ncbi:MAG: hypothetical protein ACKOLA_15130 [Spartobacteria bacterium]